MVVVTSRNPPPLLTLLVGPSRRHNFAREARATRFPGVGPESHVRRLVFVPLGLLAAVWG